MLADGSVYPARGSLGSSHLGRLAHITLANWSYHILDNHNYHSQTKEIKASIGTFEAKEIPHPNGNSLIV